MSIKKQMQEQLKLQLSYEVKRFNSYIKKCAEWDISTEVILDNIGTEPCGTFHQRVRVIIN